MKIIELKILQNLINSANIRIINFGHRLVTIFIVFVYNLNIFFSSYTNNCCILCVMCLHYAQTNANYARIKQECNLELTH